MSTAEFTANGVLQVK